MIAYLSMALLFLLGLVAMAAMIVWGQTWVFVVYCISLSLYGLAGWTYQLLKIPRGQRMDTIKGHVESFREYMTGKHDPPR